MSGLSVWLLGPPRVERDGEPIRVDTRKAIALLAYLAIARGRHSRDVLAALLWPEHDRQHSRGALRRTLSTLKSAVGEGRLEITREAVELRSGPGLWVDVEEFRQRVADAGNAPAPGRLVEALELYGGDFMAGFSLRDSVAFDDWQEFESDSLRCDLATALELLVAAHVARGHYDQSLAAARRWLSLDPLHEPAHRQLIRLLAWKGERAAALAQYRECVRILTRELGVPPLAETTELYEAISRGMVPPTPVDPLEHVPRRGPGTPATPRLPELPMVGRSSEWQALLDAYQGTADNGRLVVLEGEAGIGKTRLGQELLSYAGSRGALTAVARCHEDERSLAYGPFVEMLRALWQASPGGLAELASRWLVEGARLVPELAELRAGLQDQPALDSPGAQSRFFEGVCQALLAAATGTATPVLFLDDLQWLDEASLDLLAYLVRRLPGRPLCLLASWRSEEVGHAHRLRRMLAEAQRAGTATSLTLTRLSRSQVGELVRALAVSGSGGSLELEDRLHQETEGLPFFLAEYLAVLVQAGHAVPVGGLPLPGGARELLRARLAPVSETGMQVLTTAAVIGRSFEFDDLLRAAGRGEEETVVALEELVRRGLVTELVPADGAAPAYNFGHEKLRQFVYQESSLARRRLLHRRVGEALAAGRAPGKRGTTAGLAAHHLNLAGLDRAAAEQFVLAGEHASALYANGEALSHLRAALALGHPDTARLHERCGDLLTLLGDYPAALASYEAAAAHSSASVLPVIEHKIGAVHHRRGDWDLAESHFDAVLRAVEKTGTAQPDGQLSALRARVQADASLTAHRRGDGQRAATLAAKALQLAETADDPRALAQAHNILGVVATRGGKLDLAREHLERSLVLAKTLAAPSARIAALNNLALAAAADSRGQEAISLMETALAICSSQGDRHQQAALHNNLADLLHRHGRHDEAMSHLKQAVTIFTEIGEPDEIRPEIWKLAEW